MAQVLCPDARKARTFRRVDAGRLPASHACGSFAALPRPAQAHRNGAQRRRRAGPCRRRSRRTWLCGGLQLLFCFVALDGPDRTASSRDMPGSPRRRRSPTPICRSVAFGRRWSRPAVRLPIAVEMAARRRIAAKRAFRSGAWRYFRFWLVKRLIQVNPMVHVRRHAALQRLSARCWARRSAANVVIFSTVVPVCTGPAVDRRRHDRPQGQLHLVGYRAAPG